jgi:hypothetical protein
MQTRMTATKCQSLARTENPSCHAFMDMGMEDSDMKAAFLGMWAE